jgi:hypothetical protein
MPPTERLRHSFSRGVSRRRFLTMAGRMRRSNSFRSAICSLSFASKGWRRFQASCPAMQAQCPTRPCPRRSGRREKRRRSIHTSRLSGSGAFGPRRALEVCGVHPKMGAIRFIQNGGADFIFEQIPLSKIPSILCGVTVLDKEALGKAYTVCQVDAMGEAIENACGSKSIFADGVEIVPQALLGIRLAFRHADFEHLFRVPPHPPSPPGSATSYRIYGSSVSTSLHISDDSPNVAFVSLQGLLVGAGNQEPKSGNDRAFARKPAQCQVLSYYKTKSCLFVDWRSSTSQAPRACLHIRVRMRILILSAHPRTSHSIAQTRPHGGGAMGFPAVTDA